VLVRKVYLSRISGSGIKIETAATIQDTQIRIENECQKTFTDIVFTGITGGSGTYAFYAYHSGAL